MRKRHSMLHLNYGSLSGVFPLLQKSQARNAQSQARKQLLGKIILNGGIETEAPEEGHLFMYVDHIPVSSTRLFKPTFLAGVFLVTNTGSTLRTYRHGRA